MGTINLISFDYNLALWLKDSISKPKFNSKVYHIVDFNTSYDKTNSSNSIIYMHSRNDGSFISTNSIISELEKFIHHSYNNDSEIIFIVRDGILEWLLNNKPKIEDFFFQYFQIIKLIIESPIKIQKLENILEQKTLNYSSGFIKFEYESFNQVFYNVYENFNSHAHRNTIDKQKVGVEDRNTLNNSIYLRESNYLLSYPHFYHEEKLLFIKKILRKTLNKINEFSN